MQAPSMYSLASSALLDCQEPRLAHWQVIHKSTSIVSACDKRDDTSFRHSLNSDNIKIIISIADNFSLFSFDRMKASLSVS